MTVSKLLSLALLALSPWPPALASQSTAGGARRQTPARQTHPTPAQDELARHLSAAETFQLSGDLERAAVENRAVAAVALARLGGLAIREGEFRRAAQLLGDSLALRDDARARTNLAIAHMRLREVDRAAEEARAALALDPQNARARHALGKLLYMKGDYAGAQPELERAVVLEPDLDAAYTLGMTYLRLKQLERAKLLFEEMQAALGDSAVAHILFGRAYQETGYPSESEREFRRAAAVDPKAPRVHFYLGYLLLLHGGEERRAEAARALARELETNPRDFFTHFFLGILASTENDHPRAVRHLSEAARIRPAFGETYLYLGQSQAELGDASAEQSLRRAIELTPDVSEQSYQIKRAHFLLGRVLIKGGRREEGERELARARELQGQSLESSRQELGEILGGAVRAGGDAATSPSRAAASASAQSADGAQDASGHAGDEVLLIEESPLERQEAARQQGAKRRLGAVLAQAYHNLGVIDAQQNRLAAAVQRFAAAAAWRPDLEGLDRNWGIVSFRASEHEKAIPPLTRHLAAHPEDVLARQMLGMSFWVRRDYKQAAATLKPLGPAVAEDFDLAYVYGVSLAHLEDFGAASAAFAAIVERHPAAAPARYRAAQGFAVVGDYERAAKEFRAAAELDPRLPEAHYHAGQSLIRLNRLAEAEREFRQELVVNPHGAAAKYHLAYALLEQKRGAAEALALLREAVAAQPDFADARYQLGKVLVERGELNEAIEHLEAAARFEPSKDYVHYQLSIAYRRARRPADAERELQLYKELKASSRGREPAAGAGGQQHVP
jgi:tetratricopeptide (TPR) repeat protein